MNHLLAHCCKQALLSTVLLSVSVLSSTVMAADKPLEKFVYITNWYAQAEHGGYYQALAKGLYKDAGLDVTIRMGGPQVNILQLMAAGQGDCVMGSESDMLIARSGGVPVTTVASSFQKDPQVMIAHEDVKDLAGLKDKTLLIAPSAQQSFWPWLKAKYGLTDAQVKPYTFNVQPFVLDKNSAQQGYLTSEPFAVEKAGIKANSFLLADSGYGAYSTTISCLDDTVAKRKEAVAAFTKATMEGWKSYLADPAAANELIKKDNPNMTDEQLAYSVAKMKEMGIVDGGDAKTLGIGVMTPERAKQNYDALVEYKLIDTAKVPFEKAYDFSIIKDMKILP